MSQGDKVTHTKITYKARVKWGLTTQKFHTSCH